MLFPTIIAGLALAATGAAQTPPGFVPEITTNLMVTYNTSNGTNTVSPPGERIPRPDTVNPPSFALASTSTAGQAVLLMIDLDVPRNNSRVTLLHWLAPNVTLAQFASANGTQVTSATPPSDGGLATYLQPSPPPGDIPHRYLFLLFEQPTGFAVPSSFDDVLQTRIGFNYTAFIAETNLTSPLAANYMTVQNNTAGAATTTYPSAGATLPGTVRGTVTGIVTSTVAGGSSNSSGTGSGGSSSNSSSTGAGGSAGGSAGTTTGPGGSSVSETGAAATLATAAGDRVRTEGGLAAVGAGVAGVLGLFVMFG